MIRLLMDALCCKDFQFHDYVFSIVYFYIDNLGWYKLPVVLGVHVAGSSIHIKTTCYLLSVSIFWSERLP